MAKKTVAPKKKTTKRTKVATPSLAAVTPLPQETSPAMSTPKAPKLSSRALSIALIVLGIALLTYKVGPYFVPAIVGTQPISRFAIWNRLESAYGEQTLNDLVNEKILDNAIAQSGVKIDQAKVDEQIKSLESQFESLGGLDVALEQRGMTRANLTQQVVTQLSVEEILKDKVNPTDEAIQKAFDEGATTTYKDKKFEDVKETIRAELSDTLLSQAFMEWFEGVKAQAKVKNFGL